MAIKCDKYQERPLIDKITALDTDNATIEWYVGTCRDIQRHVEAVARKERWQTSHLFRCNPS